jgi:hypothetical protein
VRGLPARLFVTVTVPVIVPVDVGLNVTLITQLAPAATEPPQLFVWLNWELAVTLEIVTAEVPEFARVIACEALVVFFA